MNEEQYLQKTISELVKKYKCHTVILYGSRARGDATEKSDYDIMGIRKTGKKLRIAKDFNGSYLDAFIFPESSLKVVSEDFLYMKGAKVIYEEGNFGKLFIKKLNSALKKKYVPLPPDEIETRRAWHHKMLERTTIGDIEGLYRRSWLQEALLQDYFHIRKLRYWGSKESFAWLKDHDRATYLLFKKSLENPADFKHLKKLVEKVSERKF